MDNRTTSDAVRDRFLNILASSEIIAWIQDEFKLPDESVTRVVEIFRDYQGSDHGVESTTPKDALVEIWEELDLPADFVPRATREFYRLRKNRADKLDDYERRVAIWDSYGDETGHKNHEQGVDFDIPYVFSNPPPESERMIHPDFVQAIERSVQKWLEEFPVEDEGPGRSIGMFQVVIPSHLKAILKEAEHPPTPRHPSPGSGHVFHDAHGVALDIGYDDLSSEPDTNVAIEEAPGGEGRESDVDGIADVATRPRRPWERY